MQFLTLWYSLHAINVWCFPQSEFYDTIFSYSCRAFVWLRHVIAVKQFYGGLGAVGGRAEWSGEMIHLHPYFIIQLYKVLIKFLSQTYIQAREKPTQRHQKVIPYLKLVNKHFAWAYAFCTKLGLQINYFFSQSTPYRNDCVFAYPVVFVINNDDSIETETLDSSYRVVSKRSVSVKSHTFTLRTHWLCSLPDNFCCCCWLFHSLDWRIQVSRYVRSVNWFCKYVYIYIYLFIYYYHLWMRHGPLSSCLLVIMRLCKTTLKLSSKFNRRTFHRRQFMAPWSYAMLPFTLTDRLPPDFPYKLSPSISENSP
jgi:hypothetical protein